MTKFIPHGYISVDDALDHLGRELFPEWNGKEQSARSGLIGIDEWLRIKDLAPPARQRRATSKGSNQVKRTAFDRRSLE
jgi:hypothetical protein